MKRGRMMQKKYLSTNEGLRSKARSPLFSLQKETHSSPGLKAPSALAPLWVAKALESSAAENKYAVNKLYKLLIKYLHYNVDVKNKKKRTNFWGLSL